jgi:hypothetical protein
MNSTRALDGSKTFSNVVQSITNKIMKISISLLPVSKEPKLKQKNYADWQLGTLRLYSKKYNENIKKMQK